MSSKAPLNSIEMNHFTIRPGNIIQYVGRLSEYHNNPAEIVTIDAINPRGDGEESYMLKIRNWKKEDKEIRAYKDEIWPIPLEIHHLEKIGFIHTNPINEFTFNDIR